MGLFHILSLIFLQAPLLLVSRPQLIAFEFYECFLTAKVSRGSNEPPKAMQGQALRVLQKISTPTGSIFCQKPCISTPTTFLKQWKTTQLDSGFGRK